jgi:hypothetical protein
MDQHLEMVMIYTYLIMLLRIPIHTHILILTTKLHLASATREHPGRNLQVQSNRSRSVPSCVELNKSLIEGLNGVN